MASKQRILKYVNYDQVTPESISKHSQWKSKKDNMVLLMIV